MTVVIFIEGGIGVGKTTILDRFLQTFADLDEVAVLPEPADEWTECGFLQAMYNREVSALGFQLMVLQSLASRLQRLIEAKQPKVVIAERSPWSNYHIFSKVALQGMDLQMYKYTWDHVVSSLPAHIETYFLYLYAPVELLQQRVGERGREGEEGIPNEYLAEIGRRHEQWFAAQQHYAIDASRDRDEVFAEVMQAVNSVIECTCDSIETQLCLSAPAADATPAALVAAACC